MFINSLIVHLQAPGEDVEGLWLWFSTSTRWIDAGQADSSCAQLVLASLHPASAFVCVHLLIASSGKEVPRQQSITHQHNVRFTLLCNQVSRAKRCEIAYCFVNQICVLVLILVSGAKRARTAFRHNTQSMERAHMHMATNEKHTKPKQNPGTHWRLCTV